MITIKPYIYIILLSVLCLANSCQAKKHISNAQEENKTEQTSTSRTTEKKEKELKLDSTGVKEDTTKAHAKEIVIKEYERQQVIKDSTGLKEVNEKYKETKLCVNDTEYYINTQSSTHEETKDKNTTISENKSKENQEQKISNQDKNTKTDLLKYWWLLVLLILLIYFILKKLRLC